MFLRQLDLTTALRPSLLPEEILLFVQDSVGLYRDRYKIDAYQNGHAYLTSHRICYVDNVEPRQYSVAIDLKDVDRPEFYAGFLKSSPKITLYPKVSNRPGPAIRSPAPNQVYSNSNSGTTTPLRYGTPSRNTASPAPAREVSGTWVCPICSFSNPVPSNFDPGTANAQTPLAPCLACGIKPPLVVVVKAAISAMSNRPAGALNDNDSHHPSASSSNHLSVSGDTQQPQLPKDKYVECPRCTFQNHPSLPNCEICGAKLPIAAPKLPQLQDDMFQRSSSPAPVISSTAGIESGNEILKLSFRAGGEKIFQDRLKDALIQRKWLLQNAPSVPRPSESAPSSTFPNEARPAAPLPRKQIGIAGLERRDLELRRNNEFVIGSAFEDLEALMTSAKEVIAMAERFASQNRTTSPEASALLSESASALGLITTKDMLVPGSSSSEALYTTQLSRDLAELLTDDRHGLLRKEGGIVSLVDLWALFNRRRNGIELISPLDFEKAANMWDALRLPVRLRRFKSGVLVVQGRDRTDEKTIRALLEWLGEMHEVPPDAYEVPSAVVASRGEWDWRLFGRGVTAQETAGRFGWSVGVATEELEMAEEKGVLVREQDAQGVRFWENYFDRVDVIIRSGTPDEERETRALQTRLEETGLI